MSIDLKGNTNFAAFKNLQDEYIVPRTNLAAVDMDVANGLKVTGNTMSLETADPLQLTTAAAGAGVVTADVLGAALKFARNSAFDVYAQNTTFIGTGVTVTEADGVHAITATPQDIDGTGTIGFTLNGPLPVVSTVNSLYLVVVDVKTQDLPADSITLSSTGTQVAVANYDTTTTTTNVWTRLAFVLDTTAQSYTGDIKLAAVFPAETGETSLLYKNLYVTDVYDLNTIYRDELASVIGTDNAYLLKPGYGVSLSGGTINMDLAHASVEELLQASNNDNLVASKGLKSAISAGKAVDVTSDVSVSAGSITRGLTAKDPVTWTGTTSGSIGFFNASSEFPKFGDDLVYLIMAQVKNNGTANVVIDGANGVNGTLPVTLTPGSDVRIAKLFTTKVDGFFSVSSSANVNLTFSYFREYEVTGCTDEARAYIAGLDNPDNYNDYYLIDTDSVNPWLTIINMHSSPYTTVMSGLAYKLYANDGNTHTIMVDTLPPNTYGREAKLELFVAGASDITLVPPLRLAQGHNFTANTVNNCSIRFQDGLATLTVDSVENIYIVNLSGSTYTTEFGTLCYGMASDSAIDLVFNIDTDGLESSMYNATVNGNKMLYGNGASNTIVVGNAACGSHQVTFSELQLKGATVSGTAILFDSTVALTDQFTNNGAISVTAGSTVKITGASTNTTAVTGTGSMTFANTSTIDASQNATGGIIIAQTTTIPYGATVTFKGLNGYTTTITGSKTGSYFLADGSFTNSYYTVTLASGSSTSNGSIQYGLENAQPVIVFSKDLDGTDVNADAGVTKSSEIHLVGNGMDKTRLNVQTYYLENSAGWIVSNMAVYGTGRIQGAATFINVSYTNVTGSPWGIFSTAGYPINFTNVTVDGCTSTTWYEIIGEKTSGRHGSMAFTNCRITNSKAGQWGGAMISVGDTISATVTNCYFENPDAAVAITLPNANGFVLITGSTFAGAADSITLSTATSTAEFAGVNIFNGTVSGAGYISEFADNSVIESTTGTGSIKGGAKRTAVPGTCVLRNLTITGNTTTATDQHCIYTSAGTSYLLLDNCRIYGNYAIGNSRSIITAAAGGSRVYFKNCLIKGNTAALSSLKDAYYPGIGSLGTIEGSTVGNIGIYGGTVTLQGYNQVDLLCDAGAGSTELLRIVAGSTVKAGYQNDAVPGKCIRLDWQPYALSVGSYNEDGDWVIGGTATYIYGEDDVTTLEGIGSAVYYDGNSDMEDVYRVASSGASGEGTLLYGIETATENLLVLDKTITVASATLTEALTSKQLFVFSDEGKPIFGGTVSTSAAPVVAVNVTRNSVGNVDYTATTANITGNFTITGTASVSGKWLLDAGSTVTAAGAYIYGNGRIAAKTVVADQAPIIGLSTGSMKYMTTENVLFSGDFSLASCTLNYNSNYTNQNGSALLLGSTGQSSQSYCTINSGNLMSFRGLSINSYNTTYSGSIILGGAANPKSVAEKSTFNGSIRLFSAPWIRFKNCTMNAGADIEIVAGDAYKNQVIVFEGTNVFKSNMTYSTNTTARMYLIAGSTVNLSGNTKPLGTGYAQTLAAPQILVGTFDSTYTNWTTTGTATIIPSTGSPFTVSGFGNYINHDGTTNLTKAIIS